MTMSVARIDRIVSHDGAPYYKGIKNEKGSCELVQNYVAENFKSSQSKTTINSDENELDNLNKDQQDVSEKSNGNKPCIHLQFSSKIYIPIAHLGIILSKIFYDIENIKIPPIFKESILASVLDRKVGISLSVVISHLQKLNTPLQQSKENCGEVKIFCGQLKYYKPKNNGSSRSNTSSPTEPHVLKFSDKPFSKSSLPSGMPDHLSDMKIEKNRLESFRLQNKPHFETFCSFICPEDLAKDGFFYMLTDDKVKCAFCLGVLVNWERQECPREAHRLHFSTCPWVLGIDVGNVAIIDSEVEANSKLPTQCTEDSINHELQHDISLLEAPNFDQIISESLCKPANRDYELTYQSNIRQASPVSINVAKMASKPDADANLDMLQHSFSFCANNYQPQYTKYIDDDLRLQTNMSAHFLVPADLLADAGFFTSDDGNSCCYHCGLVIFNWISGDDPWIEHSRWSPRCPHLIINRGAQFVLNSRAMHPPYVLDLDAQQLKLQQNQQQQQQSFNLERKGLIDYRIEARHFKARDDFPSCLTLKQIGFETDDVKTALLLQLKNCGDDFKSNELFANALMQIEVARTKLGITAREYYEMKSKETEINRTEPRSIENDEMDWRTCKVCMDKVINITLLDCGHLCCCSNCVTQLQTCPVCRSQIKATVYINL